MDVTFKVSLLYRGSAVQHLLRNVQQIKATEGAFAALRQDGRVAPWWKDGKQL